MNSSVQMKYVITVERNGDSRWSAMATGGSGASRRS
jgi:hypothetical protein